VSHALHYHVKCDMDRVLIYIACDGGHLVNVTWSSILTGASHRSVEVASRVVSRLRSFRLQVVATAGGSEPGAACQLQVIKSLLEKRLLLMLIRMFMRMPSRLFASELY
jgi:hypothetical protein